MDLSQPLINGPILLDGPVGKLEVFVDRPKADPVALAIVLHPHPSQGGTAEHKIPAALAKALADLGFLVLRPIFRGVGRSEGDHASAAGEADDIRQLVDAATKAFPQQEIALAGFSFGAFVAAKVAKQLAEAGRPLRRVVLASLPYGPVRGSQSYDTPSGIPGALVVHGERDDRVPLSAVLDWARLDGQPVVVVPGTDHFFKGRLVVLRALVVEHLLPLAERKGRQGRA
ncbi:MAG: alpha/beta fold hydrolase [Caulobacter sp.]|nr:alpha/beta fold hydrolase [Vitreoscilla sp.]